MNVKIYYNDLSKTSKFLISSFNEINSTNSKL